MKLPEILAALFPAGHRIEADGNVVYGEGQTASGPVAVIGTDQHTTIGLPEILALARRFIRVMQDTPGRPILMLVDNSGQKMALTDELLGLYQYIAHLIKLQDHARRRGHRVIALVYGHSIAGGFVAFGLCAGQTYALADSHTSVMALPAIARVTKLPLAYLEELSKTVAVFAPGVPNFYQAGGLAGIWADNLNACLEKALQADQSTDQRAELGARRGGRRLANAIIRKVLNA